MWIAAVLMVLALVVLAVLVVGFGSGGSAGHRTGVLGLAPATGGALGRAIGSPLYRRLLGETLKLAALCALICLAMGYPLAMGMHTVSARLRRVVMLGVLAPLLIGVVMRSLGWVVVLGELGLVNLVLRTLRMEADLSRRSHLLSELAVVGSLVQVFLPFMVLAIHGAIARIDPALERMARNLGATRWQVFREILLPLSLPGAGVGVATVFTLSTGAYLTVATVGGVRVRATAEAVAEQSEALLHWQLIAAGAVISLVAGAILIRLLLAGLRRPRPGLSAPPAEPAG